ncbi:hypothetical protein WICPIJ_004442 [Wickerhamomyces pijperi]|uniref:Uncharacterized protein n=1 Tax=Wickerhamomyces pijperi TaxID=599730 RepID=A0A9P8Q7P6_WICPI|nr:hypothetical protein WICPIJ_004442 [Wickerhamomyces pijperi]
MITSQNGNGTLNEVGLSPNNPENAHGCLILPPRSDPIPNAEPFIETKLASPPVDPPGFKSAPKEEQVTPNKLLKVLRLNAPIGTAVLAIIIAPALIKISTFGELTLMTSSSALDTKPNVVLTLLISNSSLTEIGTPCRGPMVLPPLVWNCRSNS